MADVILMPRLSDSMEEGELASWHKKVGDAVEKGDLLAEINSDKATMDFESPKKGTLLYIGAQVGDKLLVGAPLVIIGKAGEAFENLLKGGDSAPAAKETKTEVAPESAAGTKTETAQKPAPETKPISEASVAETPSDTGAQAETHDTGRIFASPLAKEMAKSAGIPIQSIQGSGDNGRIVKSDVEKAVAKTPAPSAAPQQAPAVTTKTVQTVSNGASGDAFEDTPLSNVRKIIAKRLSESKFSAPHFYLTIEISMDKCMEVREQLNKIAAPAKISYNDIVVRAAAAALKKHPAINSSWMGDFIRKNNNINIGVAVAVGEGLFVPVIRNADTKSLTQISAEVRTLAGKAKEGKLQLPEMQGNTFSVSNLGMFDIEEFTAIINPPDACILAVGSIMQKPVVKDGAVAVGHVMKMTLSCDHRVIDGATGAQFLQTLKGIMEDPIRILI